MGWVWFGSLGRLQPISALWGYDRGLPVDRYYVESFLGEHARDIRGHVLEIAEDHYTRRFGRGVTRIDVLDAAASNPVATIVGDLTEAPQIATGTFDCVVLTQTLQYIYDVRAAIWTLRRILKPGGVVLATFPGISKISRVDMDRWGEYWRFTTRSAQRLFAEAFPATTVTTRAYGNVVAAVAFLHGVAAQELSRRDIEHHDPDYECLVAVRATRPTEE